MSVNNKINFVDLEVRLDKEGIVNDSKEKEIKVCVNIKPSQTLRKKINQVKKKNKGVDLCVVVDRTCFKLEEVSSAIKDIIVRMKNEDTISVVTYSDGAQAIIENASNIELNNSIEILDRAIVRDYKSPSTALGLRRAKEILLSKGNDRVRKIVLVTSTREEGAENLASEVIELKDNNISVDCIAVGEDSNYLLLEDIAGELGGVCNVMNDNSDISHNLKLALNRCHNTIITNAKLELIFNGKCRVRNIYKGRPQNSYLGKMVSDKKIVINIGNIEENRMYSYYFDTVVNFDKTMAMFIGNLSYSLPLSKQEIFIDKIEPVKSAILVTDKSEQIKINRDVEMEFYEVEIKRLERDMKKYIDSGEKTKALQCMNQILELCEKIGNIETTNQYKKMIEQYIKDGVIDLTNSITESSKPMNSGSLAPIIDLELEF